MSRAAGARARGVDPAERRAARDALRALAQTWFVHADFLDSVATSGSLDTITCFSVTKWVHLHRGDLGLVALFHRFWDLLAPGGTLILEPQPWSSYRTAHAKLKKEVRDGGRWEREGVWEEASECGGRRSNDATRGGEIFHLRCS